MSLKNNFNQCDLCGQTYSYKTKDEHIDSALCKRTQNINIYTEIIGGYRIMAEKQIANGDVDFVVLLNQNHMKNTKYNNYK